MKKIKKGFFTAIMLIIGASLAVNLPGAKAATVSDTASIAVGQTDTSTTTAPSSVTAGTLSNPRGVTICGSKLVIADRSNHRVLIYNSVPTSSGTSADVAIGQPNLTTNSANQGLSTPAANTLNYPTNVFCSGTKLFVADQGNNRVLIYNQIPTSHNASADVVVGQENFSTNTQYSSFSVSASNLGGPNSIYSDGTKLFISDFYRHRVLIYNAIPVTNGAAADVVVGQSAMNTDAENAVAANTLRAPSGVYSDGTKLFITEMHNNRVLIFNNIPTANGASADVVIGQSGMTSNSSNQGGNMAANTISFPVGVFVYGTKLFVSDTENDRILIFNSIPTSSNANADEVIGHADLTGTSTGSVASSLYQPMETYFDGTKLYVADSGYDRVLIFDQPSSGGSDNGNDSNGSGSQNVTSNRPTLPYSKKKANRKVVFTFSNLDLGKKAKKSWVKIRLSGKKIKINRVKSSGSSTIVTATIKQKKWPRGIYNLSMSYKKKVGKRWERGTRTQDSILLIY